MKQFNIAIFYDPESNFTNTVYDYLNAFRLYSIFSVGYIAIRYYEHRNVDIEGFDAAIIFYSTSSQLCLFNKKHPMCEALKSFSGPKIAIIQDEYDHMKFAPQFFSDWGVTHIVTNMPEGYERVVYPENILGNVKFIHALTGYVPENLLTTKTPHRPMSQRTTFIGYRGRPLHYKYGRLGHEKIDVGRKMREICTARGIAVDIEWTEEKRIYGEAWPEFIANCRVMLGSESGSEVFDQTGQLRKKIDSYLSMHPSASFNDISEIFLKNIDGVVPMAQISPRVFETIAMHTGLVLFEGNYSGIIQPGTHYIPLKKDFSNIDEVLTLVNDTDYLQEMTSRAYKDVILSEKYSYRQFIARLDDEISRALPNKPKSDLVYLLLGKQSPRGLVQLVMEHDNGGIAAILKKIKFFFQIDSLIGIATTTIIQQKDREKQASWWQRKIHATYMKFSTTNTGKSIKRQLKKMGVIHRALKYVLRWISPC